MKLIVCLDDQNGMLFNRRRLSKDRNLRNRILQSIEGKSLWMNAYSAGQFSDINARLNVDEQFLQKAGPDDYCFVENTDVSTCLDRVTELIVYRWNRLYPNDTVFPMERFHRWEKASSSDFSGSSHDCLTEEVYRP